MILPQNKHYLLEALKEIYAIIESLLAKQSCKNCEHFDTGKCKISDYAAPPPEVIASGFVTLAVGAMFGKPLLAS